MAFWGVEVKPGKSFNHEHDDSNGRLHISMATLGFGTAKEKSILQCNVGDKSPVYLCSLYPGSCESCQLNLEYEESDEVIFSVIGPRSIHLCGYYLRSGRNAIINEDSESYGEDIRDTETERSGSRDDDDEHEDSFIDDNTDPEVFPPSPVSIEEKASHDKRPKARKGRLQRLRRKYQSIESDDDGCLEENKIVNDSLDDLSEEINKEDSLPISFLLKNKASRRVLDKDNDMQDVPKKDKMDQNLLTGNKQNVEHTNDKDTETIGKIPSSEVGYGESTMEEMNSINLVANGADHCNLDKLLQRNEPGQHIINDEAEKADKKPSFDIGPGESTMEGINLVSNGTDHCNLDNLPRRNEPNGQNLIHQETETRANIPSTEIGHGESTIEGNGADHCNLDNLPLRNETNELHLIHKDAETADKIPSFDIGHGESTMEEINLVSNGVDHCNLDNLPPRNEPEEQHLTHEEAETADKMPSFDIGHGESTMEEINLVSNGVDHCNLDNLPQRNEPNEQHLIHEEAEAAEKIPSFDIAHGESPMEEINLVSNGVDHCNLDNPPQRNEPNEQHLIHEETETDKIPSAEIGHGESTTEGINLAANVEIGHGESTTEGINLAANVADHCNLDNVPLRNEPSQQHLIHEETEKADKIPCFDFGAGESTIEGINLVSNGVDHCNLDNLPQRNEPNEQNLIHEETETRIKIPSTEIAHGESTMEGINLAANGADHCNLVNQTLRNEPSELHLTHKNGEFSDAVALTLTNEMGPEKRTRKRKKKEQVNSSSRFKGDNASHNDVIKEYKACKDKVETDNGIHKLDDEEGENKMLTNKMSVDIVAYGFTDGSQPEDRKVEKRKKRRKSQMNVEVINCEMPPFSVKQSGGTVKVMDRNKEAGAKPSHVRTLTDGLVIEDLEMGTKNGKIARSGRKISVYYTGWLKENGIVFESNVGQAPYKFHLGEGKVILGWDVGIEGMRVGEKRRLTIPPSMAFESEGRGSIIPPNSWVVYVLELVKVRR